MCKQARRALWSLYRNKCTGHELVPFMRRASMPGALSGRRGRAGAGEAPRGERRHAPPPARSLLEVLQHDGAGPQPGLAPGFPGACADPGAARADRWLRALWQEGARGPGALCARVLIRCAGALPACILYHKPQTSRPKGTCYE